MKRSSFEEDEDDNGLESFGIYVEKIIE